MIRVGDVIPWCLIGSVLVVGCGGGGGHQGGRSTLPSSAAATSSGTSARGAGGVATTGSRRAGSTSAGSSATGSSAAGVSSAALMTGPAVVFDASGSGGFYDLPWPLDSRHTSTGGLDLTQFPNPLSKKFIKDAIEHVATDTRGASPTGTIYFRFDGPINDPVDDPLLSQRPGATCLIADIDPTSPRRLERAAIHTFVTRVADSCRPANLLALLPTPGRGLRPSTLHAAIVLRSVGSPSSALLGQSPVLTQLLSGQTPSGALGAGLAAEFAVLPQALHDLGIDPQDVAAATVFTTGDPTTRLFQQAAALDQWAPLAPTTPIKVRDIYPGFTALIGGYSPPQFQTGVPPFVPDGGEQVVDSTGMPVTQWTDDAQFQISIPRGKMPAKGFPLYFWVHGTGGEPAQFIDRGRMPAPNVDPPPGSGMASYLAPCGWAGACAAGPLSPTRIGFLSAEGYIAYDFFNPVAMRDNFGQMILEMVLFRRLLLNLRIDPSLCPGTDASASPDGKVGFDPDTMIVGGQSLGSYLAGMLAALLPDWKGCVLTGAGGSWVEFPFGPTDPIMPEVIINALALPPGESIDRFHPYIMAFDLMLGPADNTHYLERISRQPTPGHNPPNVLVIEGHGDHQVPEDLQRADVLGIGLDLAGPEVPKVPADQRDDVVLPWGGLANPPYPVQGNRTLPSGEKRTVCFVRYQRDAIREGHYVSYQLEAPKLQIADFASDISAGLVPTVQHR